MQGTVCMVRAAASADMLQMCSALHASMCTSVCLCLPCTQPKGMWGLVDPVVIMWHRRLLSELQPMLAEEPEQPQLLRNHISAKASFPPCKAG